MGCPRQHGKRTFMLPYLYVGGDVPQSLSAPLQPAIASYLLYPLPHLGGHGGNARLVQTGILVLVSDRGEVDEVDTRLVGSAIESPGGIGQTFRQKKSDSATVVNECSP